MSADELAHAPAAGSTPGEAPATTGRTSRTAGAAALVAADREEPDCPVPAEELRYPGEAKMLARTVFLLGGLYLLFIGLTLSAFAFWIGVSLLTVRVLRSRYQSDAILVSRRQFPELHALLERVAARLGVPTPRLYLSREPGCWPVFSVPIRGHGIVMSAWWARRLELDELAYFLYHELAHERLGHRFLLDPINVLENVGAISWVLATPLEIARYSLRPWSRLADFSADRVALACMEGDLATAARALAKVTAGDELCEMVDGEAFLEQSRELPLGWALYLHEITSGRLGAARRLGELARFTESDVFVRLVEGREPTPRLGWWARLPIVSAYLS